MNLIIVFAAGAILLACGIYAKWKYDPRKWQSTQAVVILSTAVLIPSQPASVYVPRIRYRFQANGRSYEGHRYAFSSSEDSGSIEEVRRLLDSHYAESSAITTWHQKLDPSISCVKLNSKYSRSQMHSLIAGGIIIIVLGLLIFAIGRT